MKKLGTYYQTYVIPCFRQNVKLRETVIMKIMYHLNYYICHTYTRTGDIFCIYLYYQVKHLFLYQQSEMGTMFDHL